MREKIIVLLCFFCFSSFYSEEASWKIGGKIHFEECSSGDYIGTIEINKIVRKILHESLDIKSDLCAENAKVMLKKENDCLVIRHYEERSKPGVGEEIHATLLYTSKRIQNGHETLKDVWSNLVQIDKTLANTEIPTLKQVANVYQKIIKPSSRFVISDIVFWKNENTSLIVAKVLFEGKDEIVNMYGQPISGGSLHITLLNLDKSANFENVNVDPIIARLKKELLGKVVKIGDRNGLADLEFGISGTPIRIRS